MTTRGPDLKDARQEREISGHPLYRKAERRVAGFLPALRAAKAATDFYQLHFDLFQAFLGAQRGLEQLGVVKSEKRISLRARKEAREMDAVRELSREIGEIEADRLAARAVLSLYRTLGDSLAWTLLGFQRSAFTVLGEGERVDRLADADGLKAELNVIDQAWAAGTLAIHTDITRPYGRPT